MYSFCKETAFTLIELIVVVSIIAIITMIALPHYHSFREQQELSQLLSLMQQNIHFSKSLASTHHNQIVICSSSSLELCENNQWDKNILIFMDLNKNKILEANEPIQKKLMLDLKYGSLNWNGGITNSKLITFQSDTGLPQGSNGSFYYCSYHNASNHRRIVISRMGHTRVETITNCPTV